MTSTVPTAAAKAELAPTGSLRVAINLGNTVLAQREPTSGALGGVSVELARAAAERLGVPLAITTYDAAGKVTDVLGSCDIAFLAIDPIRGQGIDFTAPYVIIEGTYLVRADSPLTRIDQVDRAGVRVAVGAKSAYDLFLTRELKAATIERAPSSPAAIERFIAEKLDVVAGVKQPLVEYASRNAGYRVIDGRFMAIEQAMGTPKGRPNGVAWLRAFVEEMKASGLVRDALVRSGRERDGQVAPAAR